MGRSLLPRRLKGFDFDGNGRGERERERGRVEEREARRAMRLNDDDDDENDTDNNNTNERQSGTRPEKRRGGFEAHILTKDFPSHTIILRKKKGENE